MEERKSSIYKNKTNQKESHMEHMWHDREDQSVVKSYATISENCTTAETIVQTLGWSKENTSESPIALPRDLFVFLSSSV